MSAKALKRIWWGLSAVNVVILATAIHLFGYWALLPLSTYAYSFALRGEIRDMERDAKRREKFRAYRASSRPGRADP